MNPKDLILKPDLRAVQAEFDDVKNRLDRFPSQWHTYEKIGRCLRAMGDPAAKAVLLKVIDNYTIRENDPGDHMRKGNQYRLAGELEQANHHFKIAHGLYTVKMNWKKPDPIFIEHMIPSCYLTNQDEEAISLMTHIRYKSQEPHLIVFPIVKLAQARHNADAELAAEAVRDIISQIKRHRHKVWDTFGVLPWDWYEIAYDAWQGLAAADLQN